MNRKMHDALTFNDVLLVPQYSEILTRTDCNISVQPHNLDYIFANPILVSPMDTIMSKNMALLLAEHNMLPILHRYSTVEERLEIHNAVKQKHPFLPVSVAVGVSEESKNEVDRFIDSGVESLCIDIAHGHHFLMGNMLDWVKNKYPKVHIIAGNIATPEGFDYLADHGADAIRAGVGAGCFVPGSLVKTSSGLRRIEDIQIGELVWTHTGDLQPVIDTLRFQKDEELVIVNGIECTKNHEFYVVEREHEDLINENNIHEFARWVHAEHLDRNKHILIELE